MKEIIVLQVGQAGNQIGHRKDTLSFKEAMRNGNIKCRCVLIDTEEGVLNRLHSSAMGNMFDDKIELRAVSGAGNNWAVGNLEYGNAKVGEFIETIRKLVEECSSLQAFFMIHSLGGGTGSGLGSRLMEELSFEYDDV
ncbi:MAG: hypothetical protein EZS28_052618 [Streblomastix strix]|uniref:Tubulin/FtsZ GTPase domain-containing protein n=1 Tax=Streblomastix strix TaxID=222440 RepID=A0A5J4S1T9_9EUKA|nr:MAG: hypothetical protein EZS28_052618 [Streblomastix strix]